ncbi:SpaA isopeptide-forming pilin-related protein [Streptomyces sp. NPDC051211]|uniref:SpaA isopeptide-forming pilin-related protein n=1 Tax=Streptomyces sp. NPDC051211 TaxID=3154643 RepID=UPI00344EBD0E
MTARSYRRARRSWVAGMALGALLVGAAPAVAAPGAKPAPRPAARAAIPLPNQLGPCLGPECPPVHPGINDGPFAGRDRNINTFVGDDFRVRGTAAAAEGKVVTLGDFDQNKTAIGSDGYFVGVAPVGSRVPPPAGTDFLVAGGNVTIAAGQDLHAETGIVRYAGTLTGSVSGQTVQDSSAVAPFATFRQGISSTSQCLARPDGTLRTPTGTVTIVGTTVFFTGDGTSQLQVFNVDQNLTALPNGGSAAFQFSNIPDGATVLVNVLGTTRYVDSFSGSYDETDPFNRLRPRLLWNYPDATTLHLRGEAEFQGSHLMGQYNSLTTVTTTGLSGRVYTAGSLTHGSPDRGTGQEIHSYPFIGNLPDDCAQPLQTSEVTVFKRDSVTQAPLADARFELWRETNNVPGLQTGMGGDTKWDGDCLTGPDGRCTRTVPLGEYYWREVQPPPGYALPVNPVFPVTASIPGGGVSVPALDLRNRAELGRVSVLKRDANNQEPLSGATFELWREANGTAGLQVGSDTLISECVTPANGICTRTVEHGTYYWRETQPADGHLVPANPVATVTLNEQTPNNHARVILDDPREPPITGPVSLVKRDATTGAVLAGARFQLWRDSNGIPGLQTTGFNPDTRVGLVCTTAANGFCVVNAPIGRYFWQEIEAPPGYRLPADTVFGPVLLTQGNARIGVRVLADDPRITGPVTVIKTNSGGTPLAGAVFELWRETNGVEGLQREDGNPDTQVGSACTTAANGTCTRSVPAGTYYWVETQAPPGFEFPANPVFGPLELTAENAELGVTERVVNVTPPRGRVSITKTDPREKPLAGAVFELWRESNGVEGLQTTGTNPDTQVADCTTAKNGVCARDVEEGTYYWRETQAPKGYVLPREPVFGPLELTDENIETGVTAVAVNKKQKPPFRGSIRVVKKDAETGRPLAGADFQLWRETNGVPGLQTQGRNPDRGPQTKGPNPDRKVDRCTTDRQGLCTFDGLAADSYYLRETAAPRGYVKPRDPVIGPIHLGGHNRTAEHEVVVKVKNHRASGGNGTGGNGHGKGGKGTGGNGTGKGGNGTGGNGMGGNGKGGGKTRG